MGNLVDTCWRVGRMVMSDAFLIYWLGRSAKPLETGINAVFPFVMRQRWGGQSGPTKWLQLQAGFAQRLVACYAFR